MNPAEIIGRLIEADNPLNDEDFDIKDVEHEFRYLVKYLVFPTGNRPYGGGGWSRMARHRPAPEVRSMQTNDVIFKGKSVFVNGVRRLKVNVWNPDGSPVRIDYPDLSFSSDELPRRRF